MDTLAQTDDELARSSISITSDAGHSRGRMNRKVLGTIFGDQSDPHLSHYRIIGQLGEGGMGVVYAAIDERLGRRVAIKLLRERSNVVARRRFVREARALAYLSHPNVVQIHDIGEHDDQTFIVMELIEGTDLATWLAKARRSYTEVLEVFIAAGHGLMAAHARGIVHRDFKPANVMIGDDGRIRVVDFGVARGKLLETIVDTRAPQPADRGLPELTEIGARIGTPAYMAPEQLRGNEADQATDQFSFCVALWEALYGVRPFDAQTVDAALAMMDTGEFTEMDARYVPSWLRAVVARGLSVDSADRWPSLEALIHALRRPRRRIGDWARKLGTVAMLVGGYAAGDYVHDIGSADVVVASTEVSPTQAVSPSLEQKVEAMPVKVESVEAERLELAEVQPQRVEPAKVEPPPRPRPEPPVEVSRHQSKVASAVHKPDVLITTTTTVLSPSPCKSLLSCLRPETKR